MQRVSWSLRDPESVERALSPNFPGLQMGHVDPTTFRVDVDIMATERFSLTSIGWGVPGAASGGSADLTVITGVGRGYRLGYGRSEADIRQPVLAPVDGLHSSWDTNRSSIARLDVSAVEQIARAASGEGALELRRTGASPLTPELGAYWVAMLRGIRSTLARVPDAFGSPLIASATFHQLATGFLQAFPTNWLEAGGQHAGGSAVVRRAIEFMRAHAGEPITMTDVAVAASVSTRGLHAAFTRERGEAPAQYLRRLRIDGARADLLAAAPGTTVAEVAHRWGFAHLPRFAEGYRRAFDENPSQTLRR